MTPADLEALLARATPGPWISARVTPDATSQSGEPYSYWVDGAGPRPVPMDGGRVCIHGDDMDAIAALRNAAPALLACAQALERIADDCEDCARVDIATEAEKRTWLAMAKIARSPLKALGDVK